MQTITLTVHFKTEHTPNSEQHLQQVLRAYLASKGVQLTDDNVLEI